MCRRESDGSEIMEIDEERELQDIEGEQLRFKI